MNATAKPALGATLQDFLAYQDHLVQTQQYEYLGRMKKIVLEAEDGARTQGPHVTGKIGHCLDWYNEKGPKGEILPSFLSIGQSRDRRMILPLAPVVRRDGRVGLPDIPDPSWKPRQPSREEQMAGWFGEDAPMIAQDLGQLTDKIIQGSDILVFQPVAQILFQPEINQALQPTYWLLAGSFDPASRTHPAFLVDRRTGAAHFYGGKFEIVPVG